MFTEKEMLQITTAINAGMKEIRWELADFKSEVYRRFEAIDRRFDAIDRRFESMEEKFDAKLVAMETKFDVRCDGLEEKFDARCDSLQKQIMENRLVLNKVMEIVNSSYKKYERSAENVEWCDLQIRILGSVVSEHSQKIARVEEKISEYEARNEQRGDGIPSGENKKGR